MHTPYAIRWFLAIGWFLLLSTACSFRDVPAASNIWPWERLMEACKSAIPQQAVYFIQSKAI